MAMVLDGSADVDQAKARCNRKGLRSVCRPEFFYDIVNVKIGFKYGGGARLILH